MLSQNHLKAIAGGTGKISVLNVVQLQTRGMVTRKTLESIKNNLLTVVLQGAILVMYPQIPTGNYKATRMTSVSRESLGSSATGDKDGESEMSASGDDNRSQSDAEGALPEVITKSVSTSTHWEWQAALAKDFPHRGHAGAAQFG